MRADEDNTTDNLIVGGFRFASEADAQKARMDESKIKLLESRVKASKTSDIKAVYDKALENKIFKSPKAGFILTVSGENLLMEA